MGRNPLTSYEDDLANGCGVGTPSGIFISILGMIFGLIFTVMWTVSNAEKNRKDYNDKIENKVMKIPTLNVTGTVVGVEIGKMYKVRLDNGDVLLISAKQVEHLPEQKSDKEIAIEKIKMEIEEKKKELNRIEGK